MHAHSILIILWSYNFIAIALFVPDCHAGQTTTKHHQAHQWCDIELRCIAALVTAELEPREDVNVSIINLL